MGEAVPICLNPRSHSTRTQNMPQSRKAGTVLPVWAPAFREHPSTGYTSCFTCPRASSSTVTVSVFGHRTSLGSCFLIPQRGKQVAACSTVLVSSNCEPQEAIFPRITSYQVFAPRDKESLPALSCRGSGYRKTAPSQPLYYLTVLAGCISPDVHLPL